MYSLPEDLIFTIFKIINTNIVLPELHEVQKRLRIENCVKTYPFVKSLTFISYNSNVDIKTTEFIVNNHSKIYKVWNNLYNTTFYYHRDNLWLI